MKKMGIMELSKESGLSYKWIYDQIKLGNFEKKTSYTDLDVKRIMEVKTAVLDLDVEEVRKMNDKGFTREKMAKILKVDKKQVLKFCKKHKIFATTDRPKQEDRATMNFSACLSVMSR